MWNVRVWFLRTRDWEKISEAHDLVRDCVSGKILKRSEGNKKKTGKGPKYLNLLR